MSNAENLHDGNVDGVANVPGIVLVRVRRIDEVHRDVRVDENHRLATVCTRFISAFISSMSAVR